MKRYRIALTFVSLLISALIEDAVSFYFYFLRAAFHLLVFFSPEHDLLLQRFPKRNPHVRSS